MSTHNPTAHRIFLAKVLGVGLGLILGILAFLHFGARAELRFHADSTYSGAPMYGALRIPGAPDLSRFKTGTATQSTKSTSSTSTRRGTKQDVLKRNPKVQTKPAAGRRR